MKKKTAFFKVALIHFELTEYGDFLVNLPSLIEFQILVTLGFHVGQVLV